MRDTTHDILWFIVPFGVFDTHNSHELLCTDLIINNVKCSIELNWCIIFNFRCESKRRKTTCHCHRNGLFCSFFSSAHTEFDTTHSCIIVSHMWIWARALRKSINRFVSFLSYFVCCLSAISNNQFKRNCFPLNLHHCADTRHLAQLACTKKNHRRYAIFVHGAWCAIYRTATIVNR